MKQAFGNHKNKFPKTCIVFGLGRGSPRRAVQSHIGRLPSMFTRVDSAQSYWRMYSPR